MWTKRLISLFLALVMLSSAIPLSVFAEGSIPDVRQGEQPTVLQTADGEVPIDESWDESYPYGTFAFGNHQADIAEAGATDSEGNPIPTVLEIPVYRLGGTQGRVTAWITFAPAITTDPTGEQQVYDYAASGRDDIRIEYENPNPIAPYQRLGLPQWMLDMQAASVSVIAEDMGSPEAEGTLRVALDAAVEAESYRWQVEQGGVWKDLVENGDEIVGPALDVAWSVLWDFENDCWAGTDLRCIYWTGNQAWCSMSLLGEIYEPIEAVPDLPEDLELDADPGFAVLEVEDAYDLYEFPLTFADGETVKYLRVTALDDEVTELPEVALFTITRCEGGELGAACPTLSLMVSDNDAHGASTLGFAADKVLASRAQTAVKVPVRREGDTTYSVSVHYETVDGTAKAGVDYAKAEGELVFTGSIDEIEIPIELIANDATEERSFTVQLSVLRGSGEDDLCRLETQEITVTLNGTSDRSENGAGQNLATLLADSEGTDVAAQVEFGQDALLAGREDSVSSDVIMESEPQFWTAPTLQPATRRHEAWEKLVMKRSSYNSGYWKDWEILLGSEGTSYGDYADTAMGYEYYDVSLDSGAPSGAYFDHTNKGSRGSEYTAFKTDANWSGYMVIMRNSAISQSFGDYFSSFLLDVEWYQIGRQKTNFLYDAWRYLLPRMRYRVEKDGTSSSQSGNYQKEILFYTTGEEDATAPSNRTIRVYTNGNNGFGEKRGSKWSNAEPESNGMKANSIDFQQDMSLYLDLEHCNTWTSVYTTSNKDLMDLSISQVDIRRFLGQRRYFNKTGESGGFAVNIYTANDDNEAGGFTVLSPTNENGSENTLYVNLKPTASIPSGEGGVTASGQLFVGSKLVLNIPPMGSFEAAQGGVYMTSSTGRTIYPSKSGSTYTFDMIWKGISQADLDADYTIHVIYNRYQYVQVDIEPSIPDSVPEGYSGTPQQYAWEQFISRSPTYTHTPASNGTLTDGLAFANIAPVSYNWNQSNFFPSSASVYASAGYCTNMQSINFHQDPEDVILYNGHGYAGNATIPIDEGDMANNTVSFLFYDSAFKSATVPMHVTISRIEVYLDGDHDEKISGTYDPQSRIFTPTGKDEFIMTLDGQYPDAAFKPYMDEEGNIYQYYLKVYYTNRPRCYEPDAGVDLNATAQLLPAFYCAITDESARTGLTEEQQSYRWIQGSHVTGKYMYGERANLPDWFDVPIGGDVSQVKMEVEEVLVYDEPDDAEEDYEPKVVDHYSETTYTWNPKYIGKLLFPFDNPTPIYSFKNITGANVSLAGESVLYNAGSGTYIYTVDGKANINGYLGSMLGRSGFAVGIQDESKPLTTLADVKYETVTLSKVTTVDTPDDINNMSAGDDLDPGQGTGPGGDVDAKEFSPDLGVKMPSLEFELGQYATIITDGYQVGVAIGLPVFKTEQTNYSGTHHNESGATVHSYVDDNGVYHMDTTSADGKTVSKGTTTYDANNPNKRTTVQETVTKDDHGRTTTNYQTVQEERRGNKWVQTSRVNHTNDPRTASSAAASNPGASAAANTGGGGGTGGTGNNQNQENAALKNFKGANEQFGTIMDFFKAIHENDRQKFKEFAKGALADDSFEQAKKGNTASRKFEASFSVQMAMMFEYNPIDNTYYFKSFGVTATLGMEFTIQVRLAACPAVYVYLKLGVEVEFGLGVILNRNVVTGEVMKDKDFISGNTQDLLTGKCRSIVFALDMREPDDDDDESLGPIRGFTLDLDGKVFMSVYDNKACSGKPKESGALSGDGSTREVLFKEYDAVMYVKLEARGDVWPEIRNLRPILGAESAPKFDGFNITPSMSMEVGAGVGIELAKFELYLKTSVAITFSLGKYLEDTDKHEFYISNFHWNIALGFNITVMFVNYSMDMIAFGVEGSQMGAGGYFTWDISATACNGFHTIWSKTTYTTAYGKSLPFGPPKPYGVNIYRTTNGLSFYNSKGFLIDSSAEPETEQEWKFVDSVSAISWSGGEFAGEIPLNADLAYARKDDVGVKLSTSWKKIKLYFDGEITVENKIDGSSKKYTESPAEITIGSGDTVYVYAKKGTYLDRYCEWTPDKGVPASNMGVQTTYGTDESLIHVTGPVDVSATQQVYSPGSETRAIYPTATRDFQLSGYNTSGDAKKLVGGLVSGYSYKMCTCADHTYVVYPLMLNGAPQLVLSRLVMTGNLDSPETGLVHPTNAESTEPYLLLDNDGFTDLDVAMEEQGGKLVLSWVSHTDADGSSFSVRTRTLDPQNGSLSQVQTLDTGTDFRFLPALVGDTTVWARSGGGAEEENAILKTWLLTTNKGLKEEQLDQLTTTDSKIANQVFLWTTQSKINELYGNKAILQTKNGRNVTVEGQLENLEAVEIDGRTFVLYNTAQAAYFDTAPDTPVTIPPASFSEASERGIIRRLYLRELTASGFGEAKLLQTAIDFHNCTQDNIAEAKLKDGMYVSSSLQKRQADPYFANLRFVQADIDGSGVQTVALFELAGNSYLIRQADLLAVADGTGGATMQPIFDETTGTEVNIGSDGTNLAAVFTAPVADSSSNAIYIAWWDSHAQSWGAPTILAMRNLQVYEDRLKFGLSAEESEKAYLGEKTGNAEYDAYIAHLDSAGQAQAMGSLSKLNFSNLQMAAHTVPQSGGGTRQQLIVLTEGALTELQKASFEMGKNEDGSDKFYETVIPASGSTLSFYAIAFGAGEQALGEVSLSLASYNFSVDSELVGEVSFTNTGTAAIRASETEPVVVKLNAGGQTIAQWKLTESIPSGVTTRLTFASAPLTATIPVNTEFKLELQENQAWENPFHAVSDSLLKVQARPDLGFGSFDLSLRTVENGLAVLDFNASVENTGNADASRVFIQFSYENDEKDKLTGETYYLPIDLSNSSFETDEQTPIHRGIVADDYDNGLTQGVYLLRDTKGANAAAQTLLSKGNYRNIRGTLRIPLECFAHQNDLSGLHLRAELYSENDNPNINKGVYSSDHEEYNSINNRTDVTINHETFFNVPDRIATALGYTLTLPVSFTSTSTANDIIVTEITDGTDGWEPRMGVCYYDPDRQVILAAPNSTAQTLLEAGQTPTGILQLEDKATNSVYAIAYKIGSMADGVNIYRDNASFTFYNANGTLTDVYAAAADQPGWCFVDKGVDIGWTGGAVGELPMNNDLAVACEDGAYFTFDTVADTLTFYFVGQLRVKSSVFGTEQTFTESPATIDFRNSNGAEHTVTVTAGIGTRIDRYAATYKTNVVPDADPESPTILWNRSNPQTASVKNGGSVPMTCYVMDSSGLQTVSFNGQTLSETSSPKLVKLDDTLWYFDYTFTKNGSNTVRVYDKGGNSSAQRTTVDWFNDVLTTGAIATAPGLKRSDLRFEDAAGNPVNAGSTLTSIPFVHSSYSLQSGTFTEQSSAKLYVDGRLSADPLNKLAGERWLASENGCYVVRVDRSDGTWARAVLPLSTLDVSIPNFTPNLSGDGTLTTPYLIGSYSDWQAFMTYVNCGGETRGVYFKQTADITIGDGDTVGLENVSPPAEIQGGREMSEQELSEFLAAREAEAPDTRGIISAPPSGEVTSVEVGKNSVTFKGYAYDTDDLSAAATVVITIGPKSYTLTANQPYDGLSGEIGPNHGFTLSVTDTALCGAMHAEVYVQDIMGDALVAFYQGITIYRDTLYIPTSSSFKGIYDGGGHTLTYNVQNVHSAAAPFLYTTDAAFRNLHTDGLIQTSAKFASGLVGFAKGSCEITNCRSSVAIESSVSGDGTHGGFIAVPENGSSVTITGCVFDGSFYGMSTTNCGGFVGYARENLTIRDSIFAPAAVESGAGSQNFTRWRVANEIHIENCCYLTPFGSSTQGKLGYAIHPGTNVLLSFGDRTEYDVSGVTAFTDVLGFAGSYYAGAGEEPVLTVSYVDPLPDNIHYWITATAGTLTDVGGAFRLTMPAEEVTINMELDAIAVAYVDAHGNNMEPQFCAPVTQSACVWSEGWYAATDTLGLAERVEIDGDVNLILADGISITAIEGIHLGPDASLTIWGQTSGTGKLIASAPTENGFAGIGGNYGESLGSFTLNGGTLDVTGGNDAAGIGGGYGGSAGSITINNGTVTAQGGAWGPGIGTGGGYGIGGSVTINGGKIKAIGGSGGNGGGAGIGTGNRSGRGTTDYTITINDGEVEAYGGNRGAGIGGGNRTVGGTIHITGGTVTAFGNELYAAGIGGGNIGAAELIEISGGRITATGGQGAAGVGQGDEVGGGSIQITGGTVEATAGAGTQAIGRGRGGSEQTALSIYDAAKVSAGTAKDSAAAVNAPDRVSACQSNTYARIEPCTVHSFENGYCIWCGRKLPHYELSDWTWEGYSKASANFIDKNGGEPLSVEAAISVERTGPGCETPGQAVYTATVTLQGEIYTDTRTESLSALGHNWTGQAYIWAEDFSSVTAQAICTRDATHVLTESAKTAFILTKPSTFEAKGSGYYVVTFQDAAFTEQRYEVEVPEVACVGGDACPSKHFVDMPPITSFAHIPIDWAVLNQITNGTSAKTFSPNDTCTRAQFVTFLWRTMGQPQPTLTANPFKDVKEGAWYYKAVLWAYENGITSGTSKTTFTPNDNCSRAQVVTFLWRLEGSAEPMQTQNPFTDVRQGAYYYKAVLWASEKEITSGTSATTFSPNDNCTRAQCVTFLYREFAK